MADKNSHHQFLEKSYQLVGSKINDIKDFNPDDLKGSRSLFNTKQANQKIFNPISVNVFAVLSGISFSEEFLQLIEKIQSNIKNIILDKDFYFVEPKNLGVEFAILKWPDDTLPTNSIEEATSILQDLNLKSFLLNIFGIQIHIDGCIILKCYDEDRSLFVVREKLLSGIKDIPSKQSNWAHIPLGRVLEPIGQSKMAQLKRLIQEIDVELDYKLLIDSIHLVHEKQWYMKDKDYIFTKELKK